MSVKLDLKDRKILYELELNARIAETELARKVELSREVTRYRIKRLEDRGIIRNYNTIINSMKLGFLMFRTYYKFVNLTRESEEEIINYLMTKVNWMTKVEGKYNLTTMIFTESVYEYEEFINEFYKKFGNYIQTSWVSIMTKLWHYKRGYLLNTTNNKNIVLKTESIDGELDKYDKDILKKIMVNARAKYVDLAKSTGLNEQSIRERIKKLEQRKIILGYTPFLDIHKLNKLYFKVHYSLKNIKEKSFKELLDYSEKHPNIVYAVEAIGGDDFEIEVQVSNNKELYKIINDMRITFSNLISDYYFMEYTKEYKFEYLPPKITESEQNIISSPKGKNI